MNSSWSVYLIAQNKTKRLDISGITAIGGVRSSGQVLSELKYKDEYMILSPTEKGVVVHPLKGKAKQLVEVGPHNHYQLLDLTILVLPNLQPTKEVHKQESYKRFVEDMTHLLHSFSSNKEFNSTLSVLFESLLAQLEMDKGLLITKDENNEFSAVVEKNINLGEPWLSESLVQKTMESQEPQMISNIIGSEFEASKSLMATGFISIASWPLSIRGETFGVLLVGSDRPHSGLSEEQKRQAQAYVQLAALMLKFHLRDLKLKTEIKNLRKLQESNDCPLITTDRKLEKTIQLASQVAETNLSLLIQGETGTGKEVMAQWIHNKSGRKGSFIAVNCSAIPENLLESILFGHKKGAFTGAIKDQRGKFELAHGGTLFLDEIGDLPEPLQAKLLRAIQERKIEPLGAQREIAVDVRVISATHKQLAQLIRENTFREDLYYRVAEVTLEIPPLRARPADVELISSAVLREEGYEKTFSDAAWVWLKNQKWSGNVRELISAVKRANALANGQEIDKEHFLLGAPQMQRVASLGEKAWLGAETLELAKQSFVQEKVKKALEITGNKKTQAAELLGVTPRTLFRYLEDLDEPQL